MSDKIANRIHWVAFLGLGLAVVAALLLIVAGPGYRMGWWQLFTAFGFLSWGAYVGIAAIVVSVVGIVAGRLLRQRRTLVPGLVGIIIGLITVYVPMQWQNRAESVPPIHDITTDTANPPQFDALAAARGENQNPIEYGGDKIAKMQEGYYTDVAPVATSLPPDEVFGALREQVAETGWTVAEIDDEAMTIEATDQTFWFGFKDDIVLRVTPTATGSRVDMRSQSRIGRSDIGKNAERVKQFLTAFEDRLSDMSG